jgi:hypothetical protein
LSVGSANPTAIANANTASRHLADGFAGEVPALQLLDLLVVAEPAVIDGFEELLICGLPPRPRLSIDTN